MINRLTALVLIAILSLSGTAYADTVKGRVKYISKKASTIQLDVTGKPPAVVRFDKNTQFVNAKGIKQLGTKDLLQVEFEPGLPATKITKVVFALPPGVEIDTKAMKAIIKGKEPYLLVDARPGKRFGAGHLPTAISIFAKEQPKKMDMLPSDKSQLLVFYCGGPTCPFTRESVEIAMKAGYTNVKGYQAGMPGWKKAKLPIHASATWVAGNLDEHSVIIDARPLDESTREHIKTAVAIPAAEFKALTRKFIKERKPARLPGVSDKRAPIFVYGNHPDDADVSTAFKELRKWGYKAVAIVEEPFAQWVAQRRPTATGPARTQIAYVRKLKKGAIPRRDFMKLEESRENVVLLDVRTEEEISKGTLQGTGALHIPLDAIEANLDKLPKDTKVVIYCSNGVRSEMAYEALKNKGYQQVAFLNETLKFKPDGSFQFE